MLTVKGVELDRRTVMYLETILWAETVLLPVPEDELIDDRMDVAENHALYGVSENEPLEDHFGIEDFDTSSLIKACEDVHDFFLWLEESDLAERVAEFASDEHVAYDFWLTRRGHGAGFWDGDYGDAMDDELGELLTEKCKEFPSQDVIVMENGRLFIE